MKTKSPEIQFLFLRLSAEVNFKEPMKLSWTRLKISIAGARLSHLVQKDRIWDHGSMAEQARIIFYLVHKAKASGNLDSLKRQCTDSCFMRLKTQIENEQQTALKAGNPVIRELAVVEVVPRRFDRPDMFHALIKGTFQDDPATAFKVLCCFVRQGNWWVLDRMK